MALRTSRRKKENVNFTYTDAVVVDTDGQTVLMLSVLRVSKEERKEGRKGRKPYQEMLITDVRGGDDGQRGWRERMFE